MIARSSKSIFKAQKLSRASKKKPLISDRELKSLYSLSPPAVTEIQTSVKRTYHQEKIYFIKDVFEEAPQRERLLQEIDGFYDQQVSEA